MLPQQAQVLIVGAGPTGLALAIALVKQGIKNIVIVDAILKGENTSRAIAIHAATLEALDSIGCAEDIVAKGTKLTGMMVQTARDCFVAASVSSLASHTRYPHILLLPQTITEHILHDHLECLGINVYRPCRVAGVKPSDTQSGLDVTMESGETITTQYVIGADGHKSTVRTLAGIPYTDIDDEAVPDKVGALVIADVVFSPQDPSLPKDYALNSLTSAGALMTLPLLPSLSETDSEPIHRLVFNVPSSAGPPPHEPSMAYIQEQMDTFRPHHLYHDNKPIRIAKLVWSSRYQTKSALAGHFVAHLPGGGTVVLIGDAAHTHSPLGGQGMNLGLRDAISLAPILLQGPDHLDAWAKTRRERAVKIIQMTKTISSYMNMVLSKNAVVSWVAYILFRIITQIPYVRKRSAWNLSGLGNR